MHVNGAVECDSSGNLIAWGTGSAIVAGVSLYELGGLMENSVMRWEEEAEGAKHRLSFAKAVAAPVLGGGLAHILLCSILHVLCNLFDKIEGACYLLPHTWR